MMQPGQVNMHPSSGPSKAACRLIWGQQLQLLGATVVDVAYKGEQEKLLICLLQLEVGPACWGKMNLPRLELLHGSFSAFDA